ncbi:hypothetical protein [Amycolatopsis sp. H20-H5]|uniref:hypothetical protein n=1 Tax=Amycolatopsis sp. H20-H5 TaxID=3046309 RepID=UPI002DB6BCE9|nr:hypothetical protein [Amycolatopsis sp. H20-H5]MEC3980685.1 hypothetical protein [Amycolatopsis sp. H20-H5]
MRRTAALATGLLVLSLASGCDSDEAPAAFTTASALADAAIAGTAQGRTASFTTDVSSGTLKSKGSGQIRFDGENTALSLVTDFIGEPLELRLADKTLFVKVPESSRGEIGDGKPWVRVSPDGTDPFSQVLGGSLDQLARQNDAERTLGQVKKAGKLTKAEQGDLTGTTAEHYWLDIDLEKLGTELPAGLSTDAINQLRGKVGHFPLELWLNKNNEPLQITLNLSPILTAAGAPDGASAKITTNYKNWGTPVDVNPPPPNQIGTLPTPN